MEPRSPDLAAITLMLFVHHDRNLGVMLSYRPSGAGCLADVLAPPSIVATRALLQLRDEFLRRSHDEIRFCLC